MRKIIVLLLALSLAACAAPPVTPTQAPTEEVIQPTQTAAVIVQTVVVTVIPTDLPTEAPTQVPSATPLPPTEVPPTQQAATEPPALRGDVRTRTGLGQWQWSGSAGQRPGWWLVHEYDAYFQGVLFTLSAFQANHLQRDTFRSQHHPNGFLLPDRRQGDRRCLRLAGSS